MSASRVRREKAALSSGCKSRPAKRSSRKQPEQSWRYGLVCSDNAETTTRLSDLLNPPSRIFPDIDRAIEWAEDDLLGKRASVAAAELPLESISILRDFTAGQIGLLASHLKRVDWPADH